MERGAASVNGSLAVTKTRSFAIRRPAPACPSGSDRIARWYSFRFAQPRLDLIDPAVQRDRRSTRSLVTDVAVKLIGISGPPMPVLLEHAGRRNAGQPDHAARGLRLAARLLPRAMSRKLGLVINQFVGPRAKGCSTPPALASVPIRTRLWRGSPSSIVESISSSRRSTHSGRWPTPMSLTLQAGHQASSAPRAGSSASLIASLKSCRAGFEQGEGGLLRRFGLAQLALEAGGLLVDQIRRC